MREAGLGVIGCADNRGHVGAEYRNNIIRKLVEGVIDLGLLIYRIVESVLFDVTDNAHDPEGDVAICSPMRNGENLVDGIAIREIRAREQTVDDDDQLGSSGIGAGNEAAAKQRDLHRAEIIRARWVINGPRNFGHRRRLTSADPEWALFDPCPMGRSAVMSAAWTE